MSVIGVCTIGFNSGGDYFVGRGFWLRNVLCAVQYPWHGLARFLFIFFVGEVCMVHRMSLDCWGWITERRLPTCKPKDIVLLTVYIVVLLRFQLRLLLIHRVGPVGVVWGGCFNCIRISRSCQNSAPLLYNSTLHLSSSQQSQELDSLFLNPPSPFLCSFSFSFPSLPFLYPLFLSQIPFSSDSASFLLSRQEQGQLIITTATNQGRMADPLPPASTKALAIPEILCLIFDCMSLSALRQASLVCREWERLANIILANQLVIPSDWYAHDLSHLWPYLDRRGKHVKALSLELSESARLAQEVDLELVTRQLDNILSRTPNLERLDVQVPREVKSSILTTVIGRYGNRLQQFDTNLLNWEPSDMAHLLESCSQIRHLSGHNFTGDLLQAIARSQPLLSKIDCTHPRFDDDELVAFAKHFPNLLRLSVSVHQFLTAKALIGVADYCFKLEDLNFHFCLSLQSNGFQALLAVSPNLRFLDLGLTEVHDADIVLVAGRCPQLESLKLPFCGNLTQMSIRAIVQSCTRLVHLDLSFCDKIMLTIFGNPSSPSASSASSSSSSSASTAYSPWGCLGLQYLDISGIHASYSADTSVASALLPAMYRQLGLLTDLRTLKLSGHGFSLKILEQGRTELLKLTKLERLDIAKLRNPLPWATIIEIGNLFPKLTELQFRSNDVIPPQATLEQEQAIEEVEARVGHRIKRGKFVDQQPEPLHQDDEDDGGQAGSASFPAVVPTGSCSSPSRTTTLSSTGTSSTPSESSLPKRKRSRSPSPTPTAPSAAAKDTSIAEGSSEQDAKKKRTSLGKATVAAEKQKQPEVMSATLRSGLEISFRLNGEDEDDSHGGPGDLGTGGGIVGWGFPEAMPY